MIDDILTLVPRLRRLGGMLVADQKRADALLLGALEAAREVDRRVEDADALAARLFSLALRAYETEGRAVSPVRLFPAGFRGLRRRRLRARPLLARYWSLPYDQRVAVALALVESFPIDQAAAIAGARLETFMENLDAGRRALEAAD